jgi:hypothetical protein
MLSLRAGLETFKYWGNARPAVADDADRIDPTRLRAALLRSRPDWNALFSSLKRDGIAVVPEYWSAAKCEQGRAEIDRLIVAYPKVVREFSGGSDKRMFGVESVSPLLAEFHGDPFLRGVGEMLGGLALYNFATLGARIDATSSNNGSGDGWHRDAHGFQYKSILYLSDVSEINGPFEYLPGSHKSWRAAFDTAIGGLPAAPNSRYELAAVERLVGRFGVKLKSVPGSAGTLLLVNTAGIHRGRPLRSGTRHALTNYFYHPSQISERRITEFPPLMPGTAERVREDLFAERPASGP